MKILSAVQIRTADSYTIEHEPVVSIELMERASMSCADWISANVPVRNRIVVVCGTGNNGGDGLAIARILSARWYRVLIVLLETGTRSNDFTSNLTRASEADVEVMDFDTYSDVQFFTEEDVIIDAIFGTGISRPITGWIGLWIEKINALHLPVISIDMPSGMMADEHSEGSIIQARHTLVFQNLRLGLLLPENGIYTGTFHVLPIGLDSHFIAQLTCEKYFLEKKELSGLLHTRKTFSHKGTYGHALLVSGSKGKMGAAILASEGCLRSGVGLLTVYVPACGYEIIQIAVPAAMALTDEASKYINVFPEEKNYSSIAIGPGIGTQAETINALKLFLIKINRPVILDADALNAISIDPSILESVPEFSILTPHPKEFERIAGTWQHDFERHEKQLAFSVLNKVYVILKGAYTCITTPTGKAFFNGTGNPGMAKGGSGDTLTGILLGLHAQGYDEETICKLGVYLHGLAGDEAAKEFGQISMTPLDLIENISKAFKQLSA